MGKNNASGGEKRPPLKLDARTRGLLSRFLADWVWPRWRQLAYAMMLTGLLAAASATYPIIIKKSFDALMTGDSGLLPWVLGAILSITLIRSVFMYLQNVTTSRIVLRISTDIQKHAFARLISADFARITRDAPGQLMSRLTNDIQYINAACQSSLNTAIRDTLSILALVGSMFYLDWALTLIVVCVYPVAALPITQVSRRLRQFAKRTQLGMGDMTALLAEYLASARLIKTFRLEDYAVSRVQASFEDVFRLRMKAVRARARLDPLLEVLGGAAVAGVVAFAYWRIADGGSTVGDLMGFLTALLMAAQPIRALGNLSGRVNEGLTAAERIYDLIDNKPQIIDRPGAKALHIAHGAISFKDVGFRYDQNSQIPALQDLNLEVPGGKTVALVGRSGAGKSTIINLVPRLFDIEEGSITIDDQDVRDVTLASLRGAISIVSQEVTLFDDTIRANIALGRLDATDEDIFAAAQAAAAHDFILAQPNGYETRVGSSGLRLSGGQRQRLVLARAILKNAPILLLDEATSALDTESEALVQKALTMFTRNRTTLVIAHRLSTVQNADLIAVIDGGTLVEQGTHAELMAQKGAYSRLVASQLLPADA